MQIGPITIANGDPLIIPEIGINHGGDFDKARRLIDAAADAGSRIVKFQCHIPDEEMSEPHARRTFPSNGGGRSIWDIISECSFSEEQEAALKKHTEDRGMVYLSSPFSVAAVERLERLGVVAYKIGSGEVAHVQLLHAVAKTLKPVIASTGLAGIGEVLHMKSIFFERLALLHCVSAYPTPLYHASLARMEDLERHSRIVGYSDHTEGMTAAVVALALGARIVEKHFAFEGDTGPDASVSMTPAELKGLIDGRHDFARMRHVDQGELDYLTSDVRKFATLGCYASSDIATGEELRDRFTVKRPGGCMTIEDAHDMHMHVAACDIKAGEELRAGMFIEVGK